MPDPQNADCVWRYPPFTVSADLDIQFSRSAIVLTEHRADGTAHVLDAATTRRLRQILWLIVRYRLRAWLMSIGRLD